MHTMRPIIFNSHKGELWIDGEFKGIVTGQRQEATPPRGLSVRAKSFTLDISQEPQHQFSRPYDLWRSIGSMAIGDRASLMVMSFTMSIERAADGWQVSSRIGSDNFRDSAPDVRWAIDRALRRIGGRVEELDG